MEPSEVPDEIWQLILGYLEPGDIIKWQLVNKRLLRLARDDALWRRNCFSKVVVAIPRAGYASTIAHVDRRTNLLDREATSSPVLASSPPMSFDAAAQPHRTRGRVYSVADWDPTGEREDIDWYNEYILRYAPLHTIWDGPARSEDDEVRGVAVHAATQRAVGCQEDGSMLIWDISEKEIGGRKFSRLAKSRPGALFATEIAQPSASSTDRSFSGPTESIALNSHLSRAYVALDQTLNEVDLETLQVISQQMYAWRITALSQQDTSTSPLSVGTLWSLHLYDPRMLHRDRSRSPEDLMKASPGEPEDSIAFLPNYVKQNGLRRLSADFHSPLNPFTPHTGSSYGRTSRGREDYAQVEPGPLSILHHNEHDIFLAGRFPSILSYDRRYFPRLQYVIHNSGARLSSLTSIPYSPKAGCDTSRGVDSTLVAAGEYNGRGSLEIYSLPHVRPGSQTTAIDAELEQTTDIDGDADAPEPEQREKPYSYKNRQDASSAKILSVATQGTSIVFSDAEGGIKWVERAGRGLIRRWNINDTTTNSRGRTTSSELVARKIVPLKSQPLGIDIDDNARAIDKDLLLWTGERVGIVTTQPQYEDHADLVKAFEDTVDLNDAEERAKAEEYAKEMRRALEQQANERIWMARFNSRRGSW